MQDYYIKALHLIFVVTWFAGLFYIVRLFIYHSESEQKEERDKNILQTQYKLMEKRLWYGITWPSLIGTVVFGVWLATINNLWLVPWFQLKMLLVMGLILYHLQCGRIYNLLANDEFKYSSFKLRLWNEMATLFLVSIVFIAVGKSMLDAFWGTVSLLGIGLLLFFGIKIYRQKNANK